MVSNHRHPACKTGVLPLNYAPITNLESVGRAAFATSHQSLDDMTMSHSDDAHDNPIGFGRLAERNHG